MGSGTNLEQIKTQLAFEHLPVVDKNIHTPPSELDLNSSADQIARTNPSLLIEGELAVAGIEDEAFTHPDLLVVGDTIALTREQLRGLLSRAALSGIVITASKTGTALMKKAQASHLIDLDPSEF